MLVDLRTNPRAACIDAGGFAMWGGLFSTFDCALLAIRQKDDPINPIMSGAITGGVLAARGQSAEQAARGVPPSPSHVAALQLKWLGQGFLARMEHELHTRCYAHFWPLCAVDKTQGG